MVPPLLKYEKSLDEVAFKIAAECKFKENRLAKLLGITVETLHEWRLLYSSFNEAIEEGKAEFKAVQANPLLERHYPQYVHKSEKLTI